MNVKASWMKSAARVAASAALAVVAGSRPNPAQAQLFGGGPKMAPEKQEAAWAIEAKSALADLQASDDATAKITETYKAARKSFQEASVKLYQDTQGDRMAALQGIVELRSGEAAKLQAALKEKLDEAKAKSAGASLCAFSQQWDVMVDALAGFKLEEKKQADSLKLVRTFVEGASKAQTDAMDTMDFQSMREETRKSKQKLDQDIAAHLTTEQQAEWITKTTPVRRQRGPGGPGELGRRRSRDGDKAKDKDESAPAKPPAGDDKSGK